MKKLYAFLSLALLLCILSVPVRGQENGPFWVYARIEVNTTRKVGEDEKHEFRVYVSNLFQVTADEWNDLLSNRTKENVAGYFDATVGKAAEARGEEFSYYDTDIEYDCTCVGTSNEPRPKSDVEKNRDEEIQTAKENGHPVVFFNWDPTGKNRERDLQEELKKNPPDKKPAPAKKTGGAR